MGIAAVDAYCAAQIFEAVGLHETVIDECFTGTPVRVGGICYGEIGKTCCAWHAAAYPGDSRLEIREWRNLGRSPNSPILPICSSNWTTPAFTKSALGARNMRIA